VAALRGYDRCALIRCSDVDVLFLLGPALSEDSEQQVISQIPRL
jgi:UTP:GlnB (protein PII) uridylyltransferase